MARKAAQVGLEARPFTRKLLSLTGRRNAWEVWSDYVFMFAAALSNAVDKAHFAPHEEAYLRITGKYDKQEQMVFPELMAEHIAAVDANPEQDFLGSVYMELELGNHWIGQFFTPYDVCRCMASMATGDICDRVRERGWVTLNDCACGAGATLIAGVHEIGRRLSKMEPALNWQNHVLVSAQDLDLTTGLMCYIQLSLLGAAAYVKIGNSITDPMREGDDEKNYWYTPMYFSPVWTARRMWNGVDRILQARKDEENR